ncbi:AlbA family DNA-binding domain-containing protein [Mesomycoplasma ovipneumoniae]
MAKFDIDIDYIKTGLENIGYIVKNVGKGWNNANFYKIIFSNSGAIVTIFCTNKKDNSKVEGKITSDESTKLKEIVEDLKHKKNHYHYHNKINKKIVDLINLKKEDDFFDYKSEFYKKDKDGLYRRELLHDILCMSNNIQNRDAYLIFGVQDDGKVIGINEDLRSNDILNFIHNINFAGDHVPQIEVLNLYYKYLKIGVIICKASKNIPFFLSKVYKGIYPNQIFTRVGDTNTPINENAKYDSIEKLWKLHFKQEEK